MKGVSNRVPGAWLWEHNAVRTCSYPALLPCWISWACCSLGKWLELLFNPCLDFDSLCDLGLHWIWNRFAGGGCVLFLLLPFRSCGGSEGCQLWVLSLLSLSFTGWIELLVFNFFSSAYLKDTIPEYCLCVYLCVRVCVHMLYSNIFLHLVIFTNHIQ